MLQARLARNTSSVNEPHLGRAGDSPECMCCIPDVGNDFLLGDTGKGTTILYTTFDEIRERMTPIDLLPRSQKIATRFSVMLHRDCSQSIGGEFGYS